MLKRFFSKKLYVFLSFGFIILLVYFGFDMKYQPPCTEHTSLYEVGKHDQNDTILILYTNDQKSAVSLSDRDNSNSRVVYFDIVYEKFVYHDGYYYLTDDTHFLRINHDGTFEEVTLSSYEDLKDNKPFPVERDVGVEYIYNFDYKQPNGSIINLPPTVFDIKNYNITHMTQLDDYFE